LMCWPWRKAAEMDSGHHELVTPEKVLSEYNEDLILIWQTSVKLKPISLKSVIFL